MDNTYVEIYTFTLTDNVNGTILSMKSELNVKEIRKRMTLDNFSSEHIEQYISSEIGKLKSKGTELFAAKVAHFKSIHNAPIQE